MLASRTLILLVAAAGAHCSSAFSTQLPRTSSAHPGSTTLRAQAAHDHDDEQHRSSSALSTDGISRAFTCTVAALALQFAAAPIAPFAEHAFVANASPVSSSTLLAEKKTDSLVDDLAIRELEKDTKKAEKEAKEDARRAKMELKRKAFFDYDAKVAEETEARIEQSEKKAELEVEKDLQEEAQLKALIEKDERESASLTKKEKAALQKEINALKRKEKKIERKEKKAEELERIYLGEEQQEKKILKVKETAKDKEELKFEAAEYEAEREAEVAKDDELELKLFKGMYSKR